MIRHPAGICLVAALIAAAGHREAFEDTSSRSGITAVLRNAATPEKHQIETMAGGVAVFDFDGDGLPDIYLANGARQPQLDKPDASWHNKLYRNRGGWKFEDVTVRAGVQGSGYHFGVAAADYDNDGRPDLFVTGMPDSILYRNRGDGTFEDVTRQAGVSNVQQWPVGAGWFDYDNDGRLDLFVVNYVRWDPAVEPFCGDSVSRRYRTYCHPKYYTGLPNTLFRNEGNGRFRDVSARTGILRHIGKGMGAAFADYDDDGDMDIFVTNDAVPDFLFRNDHGTFTEAGAESGVAWNDDGRALSSMGVDFRDIDNDGRDDIFVTALANETFPVYRNLGKGFFLDVTYPTRAGAATLPFSGWSNAILDFDNDGWKDLFAAAGDVQDNTEIFSSRTSRQRNLLLRNASGKTFEPVFFGPAGLHRGAAFGDLDGDGRLDAVVSRLGEQPLTLRNVFASGNWIAFRLAGSTSNRDGIGARIHVTAGGLTQTSHATSAVGYASSSLGPVHFGLGGNTAVDAVEIRWPSGQVQRLGKTPANRVVSIAEPSLR